MPTLQKEGTLLKTICQGQVNTFVIVGWDLQINGRKQTDVDWRERWMTF